MTRVIEFIGTLNDGGAETLVKDYVKLIDRDKFDVVVVCVRDIGFTANKKQIIESNIPVIFIYKKWNQLIRIFNKLFGKWYIANRLRRIVKEHKSDVLHVHLPLLKYVSCIRNKLKKVKVIYTCHNVVDKMFAGKRKEERIAAEKLIKGNNLRLIALHNEMSLELNDMFGVNNTVVVHNGIDFDRFLNPSVSREEKRKKLGIPENAFVIGHVGRFMEQKNHTFLVDVFFETAKINAKAFLLMIGSGDVEPVKKKLDNLGLNGKYIILSHRSDVNDIMHAMDVFVLPSLFEGLPLALVEAQVSGLKCVASNRISEEAFLTEKAYALPLGNARQWAEVIVKENSAVTPNGKLEDYDMKRVIKRLEKLYTV